MTKIFISYSRKDTAAARRLVEALKKDGMDAWVDWEDIPPTADWEAEIQKGIASADGFLFLLSPDSLASEVCAREVEWAVQNGKRLLPVVVRDIPAAGVRPELGRVNWIFLRPGDDFDPGVAKLLAAVSTDLVWVEAQRGLQIKALEWRAADDRSLLLRGAELKAAEEALAAAGNKDPQPTDLQRQFVLESRRNATRTRNLIGVLAVIIAFVLAIASVIAVLQSRQATFAASTAQVESGLRGTAQVVAEDQAATAIAEANLRATAQAAEAASAATAIAEANARATAQAEAVYQGQVAQAQASTAVAEANARATAQANAVYQQQQAQNQAATAVAEANARATAQAQAVTAQAEAVYQQGVAEDQAALALARALAAEAELARNEGDFTRAALLAMLSMQSYAPLIPEAENMLRDILITSSTANTILGNNCTYESYLYHTATALAFSPDSRWLASGAGRYICLWDIHNPNSTPIQLTLGAANQAQGIAFTMDGSWLIVSGGPDQFLTIWNMNDLNAPPMTVGWSQIMEYNPTTLMAVSPDSHWVATAYGNKRGNIYVYDLVNQTEYILVDRWGNSSYPPQGTIMFTSDSRYLLTGDEHWIHAWDTTDLNSPPRDITTSYPPAMGTLTVSPDGHWLAGFSSSEEVIRIWSDDRTLLAATTPNEIPPDHQIEIPTPTSIGFTPDSMFLAVGSAEGYIRLYLAGAYSSSPRLLTDAGQAVTGLVFSPNNRWMAAISGSTVWVWDRNSFTAYPLVWHTGDVRAAVFSPDSDWLATFSLDGTARLWDMNQLVTYPRTLLTDSAISFALQPGGSILAANSYSIQPRLWDLSAPQAPPVTLLQGSVGYGKGIDISPNGRWLATGSQNAGGYRVYQYDFQVLASPPVIIDLPELNSYYARLFFANNSYGLVATSEINGTIRYGAYAWDPRSPTPQQVRTDNSWTPIALSSDSRWAAYVTRVNSSWVTHITDRFTSGAPLALTNTGFNWASAGSFRKGEYDQIAFSPNNRWLVLETQDGLAVWPVPAFSNPIGLSVLRGGYNPTFSPDSRYLSAVNDSGLVIVWATANLSSPAFTLPGHWGMVNNLVFSSDSLRLASGGEDKLIRIWNLTDPDASPVILRGSSYPVYKLEISSDRRWLVATDIKTENYVTTWGMNLMLWPLWPIDLYQVTCDMVSRNLTQAEWDQYVGDALPYRAVCP